MGIPKGKLIAIDTETTGLSVWHGDRPFIVSFCNENGDKDYFEWDVNPYNRVPSPRKRDVDEISDLLASKNKRFLFWNAQFDLRMLRSVGCVMPDFKQIEEVMGAIFCLNSAEPNYQLKSMANHYGDYSTDDEEDLKRLVASLKPKAKDLGYDIHSKVEPDYWLPKIFNKKDNKAVTYAMIDAERTAFLWFYALEQFKSKKDCFNVYRYEMEKIFPIVFRMTDLGMKIDIPEVNRLIRTSKKQKLLHHDKLIEFSENEDFEPKDESFRWLLFEKLKFKPRLYTTKGKKPKVDTDALAEISHPVVDSIQWFRGHQKAIGSYYEKYKRLSVNSECESYKVIHTSIRQFGQKSFRWSSSEPNLQSTCDPSASRASYPVNTRKPFGPKPGFVWYLFDYSQLEVRLFAILSGSEDMINVLLEGGSLHKITTNRIFGGEGNDKAIKIIKRLYYQIKDKEISTKKAEKILDKFGWDIVDTEADMGVKNSYNLGKMCFFLKQFRGGAPLLAERANIPLNQARELSQDYDRALPDMKKFGLEAEREAKRDGFCRTIYENRLYFPYNPEKNEIEYHKASSYRVQGSAAALIKKATVNCSDFLIEKIGYENGYPLLQIHDELIFEIREGYDHDWIIAGIKKIMENEGSTASIEVPTKCTRVTKYWTEGETVQI